MITFLKQLLSDEEGATMVEYALMIALIAAVVVGAVVAVSASVNSSMNSTATTLNAAEGP